MRTATICFVTCVWVVSSTWLFVGSFQTSCAPTNNPQGIPLPLAHSHNDYEHSRPLLDAIKYGFCSVEVDVWVIKDFIFVAHYPWEVHPERSLEKLYLEPLRKIVKENEGSVYKNGPPFFLLIDVKTPAKASYSSLDKLLSRYADILTVVKDGKLVEKAVTVVLTGNRDIETVSQQKVRYVGIDGRNSDLESTQPSHLIPWISEQWTSLFSWNGVGKISEKDQALLREIVRKAHRHNRKVRFWDTPDTPILWAELKSAEVDFINTDDIEKLAKWLQIAKKTE